MLVVAKRAQQARPTSIDSASRMITELPGGDHHSVQLLRSTPATVTPEPAEDPR
jgi:hypothetical protein